MARETRFARRMLGRALKEFIDQAYADKLRARMVSAPSRVLYVFLATEPEEDIRYRHVKLFGHCLVARSLDPDMYPIVIGISISKEDRSRDQTVGVETMRLDVPWSDALQEQAEYARQHFGWFRDAVVRDLRESEYPTV